jgi:hypothetical protein
LGLTVNIARTTRGDLLLCAKHLFIAAHLGWIASEPSPFLKVDTTARRI